MHRVSRSTYVEHVMVRNHFVSADHVELKNNRDLLQTEIKNKTSVDFDRATLSHGTNCSFDNSSVTVKRTIQTTHTMLCRSRHPVPGYPAGLYDPVGTESPT